MIIDATLIRALLLPALMALLGRRNWWAPAPLRRLHQRAGMTESPQGGHRSCSATERIFSRAQAAVTGRRCPSRPRRATVLGWTHGIGFLVLFALIYLACSRRVMPWPVLASAVLLTPFGSSIHIELLVRRGRHGGAAGDLPSGTAASP